ncbi:ATP-binding cassette domain-containing protein [Teichococcus aestuarii]|uniref:ATP-binding cassette domain-containing protein n=1 Tax=Teichococcus aestuarii TaxID=568898 RepID=UPI00360E3FD2
MARHGGAPHRLPARPAGGAGRGRRRPLPHRRRRRRAAGGGALHRPARWPRPGTGCRAAPAPGEAVVITGASGSGKSTLFRALAGIWPFGTGRIALPPGEALFLPQRPYIPLGTLRAAICYPHDAAEYPEAAVVAALEQAGLGALRDRLDAVEPWERRLSGGEQQRLALARALLLKPRWLFLDEATASLDPEAEEHLYATLRRELPETAILSIAHRPAVVRHHDRVLRLSEGRIGPA